MSTRTSERGRIWLGFVSGTAAAIGLAALVVACSGEAASEPQIGGEPSEVDTVSCALNGALTYTDACTLERAGTTVVIHHPNGGFRRFEVLADGGLAEADGAQRAVVVRSGSSLQVTLGADRYRLDEAELGHAR